MLRTYGEHAALPVSPHFTLEELAPGVYAAIAEDQGAAGANAGIVDLGEYTLLFDSMLTPAAASDLRRVAEELFSRPVSYLINSHWHRDHIRGNAVFGPETEIVATRRTRELMLEHAAADIEADRVGAAEQLARMEQAQAVSGDPQELNSLEFYIPFFRAIVGSLDELQLRLPDRVFETRRSFRGQRRAAEAICLGGGHSQNDTYLYLPDDQIAFVGDLLFNGFHPPIADGDPAEWLWILEQLVELDIELLAAGHGGPGLLADLGAEARYFRSLRALATEAHARGLSEEETALLPMPSAYSNWRVPRWYRANLRRMYREAANSA